MTLALTFVMNYRFIQEQLKTNVIQEIENSRNTLKLNILSLKEGSDKELKLLFPGDNRGNPIQVQIFDVYGKEIMSSSTIVDSGLDTTKKMMLNGIEDTLYINGVFYSFTHIEMQTRTIYSLLSMSDQRYIEGIRNYYFRMILVVFFVGAVILMLGFKFNEVVFNNVKPTLGGIQHGTKRKKKRSKA